MPLGDDVWRKERFISATEIMSALAKVYGEWKVLQKTPNALSPSGPAKYYVNREGRVLGVIEAVSNHFCSTCNRLRVSASGRMSACLFSRTDTPLLDMLRDRKEECVRNAVQNGINAKPDCWENERDGSRRMSEIGG
jgi:cyclic pyranopterin phosphate synthase